MVNRDRMVYGSNAGASSPMARVIVDARENALIELFKAHADGYEIATLPVGDVRVEYEHGCRSWICERKGTLDLAQSIKDGRWKDQKDRLFQSGLRVVFVLEGDLREADAMYKSVFSAWLNVSSSGQSRVLVFRTWDCREAFDLLCGLVGRLENPPPSAPSTTLNDTMSAPRLTSKREKNADCVFVRQLMCIPSISEGIAKVIVEHFGNLVALQEALNTPKTFPALELGNKQKLGKARVQHLAKHLLAQPEPAPIEEDEPQKIEPCECVVP